VVRARTEFSAQAPAMRCGKGENKQLVKLTAIGLGMTLVFYVTR